MQKYMHEILLSFIILGIIIFGIFFIGYLSKEGTNKSVTSDVTPEQRVLDTININAVNTNISVKEIYKDGVKYLVFSNGQDIFVINAEKERLEIDLIKDKLNEY